MLSRRSLLAVACLGPALPAAAQPFLIPRGPASPLPFAWTGSLGEAAAALAGLIGFQFWQTMASGLPFPDPPPLVGVSVGFAEATPDAIVQALNRQVASRAVVVLDPQQRFVGVVYYG